MNSKTLPSDSHIDAQTGVDYIRLFRELPDPYILFEATDPTFRIVDVNKAREDAGVGTREDYVGHPLFETYPYTDKRFLTTVGKDLRQHLMHLIRTGRSYQLDPYRQSIRGVDGVIRTAYVQGTYYPLRDASGKIRYILGGLREVTDELHAMERVATAESRLNAALTIGKVGSWVFDLETRRIIGDDNFKKIFKMSDTSAGRYDLDRFIDSINESDKPRVVAAAKRSMEEHVPFEEEYRVTISDGTERYVLSRGNFEEHNGRIFYSGVAVDLTEQRVLEEEVALAREKDRLSRRLTRTLQQRNEELEAIGRTKDEFVALASHQLRTPATAVKQYIGMMLQGYVGEINDEQTDVLTKAFESNERQIQIINQILSAARADTGRLVMMYGAVDLCTLVRSTMNDMEEVFLRRQQTFTVTIPKRPIMVEADAGYIRMAIENVLQNAHLYTPVGGTITVKVHRSGANVVVRVTDTGVGIKEDDLGKLFVKFSRIHNPLSVEAGGSGIGLYLTAEILRLHDGEITVSSQVGKGSTFAISLPLRQNNGSESESDN